MAVKYQVKAAAAVVKLKDGRPSETYLYRGGLLPANADPAHVKHLLDTGLITKVTVADPAPAGTGDAPATEGTAQPTGTQPAGATAAKK
ncbi:MAG: hypothetical protein QJR09_11900 [Micrococcus sp.]|nr:hypothetical protein [Micrococcus sp.]